LQCPSAGICSVAPAASVRIMRKRRRGTGCEHQRTGDRGARPAGREHARGQTPRLGRRRLPGDARQAEHRPRARALRAAEDHDRAGVWADQIQPAHGQVHAERPGSRPSLSGGWSQRRTTCSSSTATGSPAPPDSRRVIFDRRGGLLLDRRGLRSELHLAYSDGLATNQSRRSELGGREPGDSVRPIGGVRIGAREAGAIHELNALLGPDLRSRFVARPGLNRELPLSHVAVAEQKSRARGSRR
jgi:hypothetical protein